MLADINNYNKACIKIAYHRIFYLLHTEEHLHIDVSDGATLHPYFSFLRNRKVMSLQFVRNWALRNESTEK